LAYLHIMRADLLGQQHGDVLTPVRENFSGVLVANMGYSAAEASDAIALRQVDAVAFGTPFISNPDLPERIRVGAPLNQPNPATFYAPGSDGYTDYPTLAANLNS
jgi:N-ethylmaleimide reductase